MGLDKFICNHITDLTDDKSAYQFIESWINAEPYITAHTSGSTGNPKEIKLLKRDMEESAAATCRFFNINESSQMVCPLSCTYIAGKIMVVRSFVSKSKLWLEKPSNTPILHNYGQIDLLPIVPSQLIHLLDNKNKLSAVKNLLIGGAPLSNVSERKLFASGINAFVSYGMTETCSHVALRRIGESCYKALPGISFGIDSGNCLRINADNFSFRSLQTNDVIELIDDKTFIWVGRRDNVINSGGIKIQAEQIEEKIDRLIHHKFEFYVTSEPDAKWGERPVMVMESSDVDMRWIEALCHENLAAAERPARIIRVRALPKTATGKIRRLSPTNLSQND